MPDCRTFRVLALLAAVALALGVLVAAPTAQAQPAQRVGSAARDGDLTTYPYGLSVRRESNVSTRLASLPAGFRQAARAWLERAYREAGSDEACSNSPLLSVRAYHRDGFVSSTQGVYPATGEPDRCAQGGYASIWSGRGGTWREVVAGQDAPACSRLVYHRVPRSLVGSCVNRFGQVQSY